jgi:hypothetical protein
MLTERVIHRIRSHFPIFSRKIYLHSCSQDEWRPVSGDADDFFAFAWRICSGGMGPRHAARSAAAGVVGLDCGPGVLGTGITTTTWWAPAMRPTILSGVPWLAFLTVTYLIWKREKVVQPAAIPVQTSGK